LKLIDIFKKNRLFFDFLLNSGGSIVAQVVAFLFIYWTTQLYTPKAFGNYATLLSKILILTTLLTLRMELVLVTNKEEDYFKASLVAACTLIISVTLFFTLILFLFFDGYKSIFFGSQWQSSDWIIYLSILVLPFSAFRNIGNGILIRNGNFKRIAKLVIIFPIVSGIAQVAFSFPFNGSADGLLISYLTSMFIIDLFYLKTTSKNISFSDLSFDFSKIFGTIKKNSTVTLWRSLTTISEAIYSRGVYIVMVNFVPAAALGQFNLAQRFLKPPTTLFSTISNVFFHHGTKRSLKEIESSIRNFLIIVVLLSGMLTGFFLTNGEAIFDLVFGSEWKNAGLYIGVLFIGQSMVFITSGMTRFPDIVGIQKNIFYLQFLFTIIMVGGLYWSGISGWEMENIVGFYTGLMFVYNLVWVIYVFIMSDLNVKTVLFSLILFLGTLGLAALIDINFLLLNR